MKKNNFQKSQSDLDSDGGEIRETKYKVTKKVVVDYDDLSDNDDFGAGNGRK